MYRSLPCSNLQLRTIDSGDAAPFFLKAWKSPCSPFDSEHFQPSYSGLSFSQPSELGGRFVNVGFNIYGFVETSWFDGNTLLHAWQERTKLNQCLEENVVVDLAYIWFYVKWASLLLTFANLSQSVRYIDNTIEALLNVFLTTMIVSFRHFVVCFEWS